MEKIRGSLTVSRPVNGDVCVGTLGIMDGEAWAVRHGRDGEVETAVRHTRDGSRGWCKGGQL
eukprot:1161592-Pelagomonas_calceolata.AAC.4